MMDEIDKYFAIIAGAAMAVASMVLLDTDTADNITMTALTGVFALAGTGLKKS